MDLLNEEPVKVNRFDIKCAVISCEITTCITSPDSIYFYFFYPCFKLIFFNSI